MRSGFIIGYHGCDAAVAEQILAGAPLKQSAEAYDWLGPGAYFWEGDYRRALEWAEDKVASKAYVKAAVVGAVIDPGRCLDLTLRENLELLAITYEGFKATTESSGFEMPVNKAVGSSGDKLLRYLDCAVITHLHGAIEAERIEAEAAARAATVQPFDSVRGLFVEGVAVYPGAGFHRLTHTQVAVRTDACIKAVFRPREAGR